MTLDLLRNAPGFGLAGRFLMLVKTYPIPSSSYEELVCCAGLDAETGRWIRMYPGSPWPRSRELPAAQQDAACLIAAGVAVIYREHYVHQRSQRGRRRPARVHSSAPAT